MYNISQSPEILILENLNIPSSGIHPTFFLGLITYLIIMTCNSTLLFTIIFNRQLHKPMYLLLINLLINDMMGATAFYPVLITSILLEDRTISYAGCFFQALIMHLYGGAVNFILSAMAYDRHLAVCYPLRYHSLMSNRNCLRLTAVAWLINVALMGTLLGLLLRFKPCRASITEIICGNGALLKLICEDTTVNNYYGLFVTVFVLSVSFGSVLFTYSNILFTALKNKQFGTKRKAIRTCSSHLMVFLVFQLSSISSVVSARLNQGSTHLKQTLAVLNLIVPPIVNPLIYGLNTIEIRNSVIRFINNKVSPPQNSRRSNLN